MEKGANQQTSTMRLTLPKELERNVNFLKKKTTDLLKEFDTLKTSQEQTLKLIEATMAVEP